MTKLITDLAIINELALTREKENNNFRSFIKELDTDETDKVVHDINDRISSEIDCTQCGNCCKSLMINVTGEETIALAAHLQMDVAQVKEKYIEESLGGVMIINTIPCHFLKDKCCTIYENRFTECRNFPHLDKPNLSNRLGNTMMYYGMCPIIFNVIETLKTNLGFKIEHTTLQ
ncbi:YkgJ family cysteine cluster protein [soil metagenome]